jgi:hypothetical protein
LLADLIEDTSVVEAVAGYRASTLAAAQAMILLIALCMASTYRRASFQRPPWRTTRPAISSIDSGPSTCVGGKPDATAISSAVRAPRAGSAS